jgi:hypothetical protein
MRNRTLGLIAVLFLSALAIAPRADAFVWHFGYVEGPPP